MTLDRIDPPELPRPSGFAHAVAGTGRTVFLAGQTAQDAAGRIVPGNVVAQFERALAALTIYIVDVDDYRAHAAEIGAVWRRLAGSQYPATAGVGVARLWDPAALVELQGIALLPTGPG